MVLHDIQGLVPEAGDDALGQLGAHPLDGAGGEVAEDGGGVGRQVSFVLLHLELAAVLGVMNPVAPQNEAVAVPDVGHGAAGGDDVVLQTEVQNRVAVVLIGVDDVLHGALELGQAVLGGGRVGDIHGEVGGVGSIGHGGSSFL